MPMTLTQYLEGTQLNPITKGVIYTMVKASPVASRLPFETIGDIQLMMYEADEVPVPSHRALNSSTVTEVSASMTRRTETLKIIANTIKVDRQLTDNKSAVIDPIAFQVEAYSKGVAYELVNMLFWGDPDSNPDQPAGLVYRFLTDPRLSDGSPAPGTQKRVIDANNLNADMTLAASRAKFWDALHQAFSIMPEMPDVIITNRQGRLAFASAARYGAGSGGYSVDRDNFDRIVERFMGVPILDAGVTAAGARDLDTTKQIIPTTGNWANSIWLLKFGVEWFTGIQKRPLEVIRKDPRHTVPFVEVYFEWAYGFHLFNPFSVVVIRRAF